ncbi:hypothetical protein N6H18_09190 [Reichenbachiella agarivorans]|uniref:LPP20 lipoprotein n=1 Tax=Reichenbachiella agarivorans TaxID=2979464 RepID=A0ABY6CUB2_9BACT|nr:hypothetical protein [Reichenbachiella agarivorans]UXP34117.1 hypothetical protein N6H18_09190 [Reichenbachiella agarivorans]
MKTRNLYALGVLIALFFAFSAQAQQDKKDVKALKKELNDKAIKEARKEAKQIEKDGWFTQPGTLPLDKQIETAWMKEAQVDDEGYPEYFVGSGTSLAGTQSAAKLQASTIAKQDLAGRISSTIASIIETNIATEQLTAEDAATIQQTVSASTEIIAQKLARVIPLTELYRKEGKNYECQIRIAYSQELAKNAAKDVIKQELEDKTNVAREKLDKLMNF